MLHTDETLMDTYMKGYKQKLANKFQEEDFITLMLQSAYSLGRAHATQGKQIINETEIVEQIHNLYSKKNYDYF